MCWNARATDKYRSRRRKMCTYMYVYTILTQCDGVFLAETIGLNNNAILSSKYAGRLLLLTKITVK